MRLRCDYCGKRTKKVIKCKECDKWLCPVCIVNTKKGGFCPTHSVLIDHLMVEDYFEEKYNAERTLHGTI